MCYSTFNILSTISHKYESILCVMPISVLFYIYNGCCCCVGLCSHLMNSIRHFNKSSNLIIQHHPLFPVLYFDIETIFSYLFSTLSFPFWKISFCYSSIVLTEQFLYSANCLQSRWQNIHIICSCLRFDSDIGIIWMKPMAGKKGSKRMTGEKSASVILKLTHNGNQCSVLWQK